MKQGMDQLSILACVTGLAIVATCFALLAMDAAAPQWLPFLAVSIAGFELFAVVQGVVKKRRGGGSNV